MVGTNYGGGGWRKIGGRRWEGGGPGMPGPYRGVDGWQVLAGRGGRHICRPYGVNG